MTSNSYVQIRELRRHQATVKRFKDWQRWKLWFPFVAILVVYPLSKFFKVGDEFVSAFGHGDLLLFSALVLIELSVETTHISRECERDPPDNIDSIIENSKFAGLILILIYGAMKFMMEHESKLSPNSTPRTQAYCALSLSVTFFVVSFSVFAFWTTLTNLIGSKEKEQPGNK
jgi:hypothetical protein